MLSYCPVIQLFSLLSLISYYYSHFVLTNLIITDAVTWITHYIKEAMTKNKRITATDPKIFKQNTTETVSVSFLYCVRKESKMRKAIVLLLLIATKDMIKVQILPTPCLCNGYYDYVDDKLGEEEEMVTEESDSVGTDMEEATVEEDSLDRRDEDKWLHTAVQDIAYYLRAHKFNDFDRRYHEDEETAPRVRSLISL